MDACIRMREFISKLESRTMKGRIMWSCNTLIDRLRRNQILVTVN